MKIKEIEILGLNDSDVRIHLQFNEDINIITGRNGSGKTTILKLLWYCISSNIERALREVVFSSVRVVTTEYSLSIERTISKGKALVYIVLTNPDGGVLLDKKEPLSKGEAVNEANALTLRVFDTSIFFPTFRRIEGGFSMDNDPGNATRHIIRNQNGYVVHEGQFGNQIQKALESHADMLSVGNHKFVSSISTVDISQLVTRKHNDATVKVNHSSKSLSEKIFAEIRNYKQSNPEERNALRDAVSTLDKINQDVVELERIRDDAFKPINVLSDVIFEIFRHKGIRLNVRVTLGDIDNSINSDALSAGEKQMLSFLCYNALYNNCPFFIDEPELSLHVDWQRILLNVMAEQKTNNQLFIATHSPFIYTQYEDKEILIGSDRGG